MEWDTLVLCGYVIFFYNLSKSVEFVNVRNDFKCLVIKSCLLIGQFPFSSILK